MDATKDAVEPRLLTLINAMTGKTWTLRDIKTKNMFCDICEDDLDIVEIELLVEDEFNIDVEDHIYDRKTKSFDDLVKVICDALENGKYVHYQELAK